MSALNSLEEKLLIPLSAIWAAKAGFSSAQIETFNSELLFSMPLHNAANPAIILGSTRATAFAVKAAYEAGHHDFVIIGGKAVGDEDHQFTAYIQPGLSALEIPLPHDSRVTESEYGSFLLEEYFGVSPSHITTFDADRSRHTSGNMQILKDHGYNNADAVEFYTLSGFARRAMMTARRVLGEQPEITAHNAFPPGVTLKNWFENATARSFIAMEAAKTLAGPLSKTPLYVRMGYCSELNTPQCGC